MSTNGNFTSLIDKIFSSTYMQLYSGTISYDISNHLPIFCATYNEITNDNTNHTKYIGNSTEEKIVNLSKLTSQKSWIQFCEQISPEHSTIFLKFVIHIINFVFHYQRNTLYLVNQGKIGVSKELSCLVKLNVSTMNIFQ